MWDIITGTLGAALSLFQQVSPYLVVGIFLAGILHVMVPVDVITRYLGRPSLSSVGLAVIIGIPLPLCSCSVIPTALMLHKKGASLGAVMAFLIATPITGIDSIMATYALMGGPFTLWRILVAAVTALLAGLVVHFWRLKSTPTAQAGLNEGDSCLDHESHSHTPQPHRLQFISFVLDDLIGSIWLWLCIGILIGGVITHAVPDVFIQTYLGSRFVSMGAMLIISVPMYVCATGSIPIAAALVQKGLPPGAALVFLLAGPASSVVTLSVVSKMFGGRFVSIYTGTLVAMSLAAGLLMEQFFPTLIQLDNGKPYTSLMFPEAFHTGTSVLLALLILFVIIRNGFKKKAEIHG